ncbi:MAG: sensor histidine kinase, partial [Acidimicrobiales bacterium]
GAAAGPARAWVEVRLASMGTDLVLRVSDSGPGIPPQDRDTIFTDGYSTKASRTGARRGLGLALVRQLVERRGGMVEVSQGVGAVFTVLMPDCVLDGARAGAAMGAEPGAAAGQELAPG